ncbi:hypothetical protein ACFQ3P_06460 [Paraburkholderia sabiae]|uniref:Uncharacterized protein n=1 Tax=Paraburkholderia sabiae TaxID=273251 RepID=A0ABU9QR58_9BURK|nr:hypothetical protein [Paraburkholderia sabiae]WJZ76543.1 hypothetical protein QEN71_12315 [Paraburkholderia sabiae]CAD6552568.1 hypothetical protein LMG24235_05094 [Paraburkholderia sabiae]
MNMATTESFQTNTFGFNLPCRQFVIAAERTRERRLPMVDEFVLRTLHAVRSITATRLARFFGFEGKDLGIVISDLQARGLVVVEDDTLTLHASAKELFRTSNESAPTITFAEPMHADVWFDLVTKHMASGRGLRNVQHLISIPARQSLDENEAGVAFHDNFREYLRIARGEKSPDEWTLYSILDVHAGRYSFVQIGGSEILRIEPVPKIEARLQLDDYDRGGRARRLTEAMAVELSTRDQATPSQASSTEFARLMGKDDLVRWTRPDGSFDLSSWYANELRSGADITTPLIGYPYVERNRKAITKLLDEAKVNVSEQGRSELLWQRPGGTRWGATEDLPTMLESLRSAIRVRTKGANLSTALISPAAVNTREALLFTRVFDRGLHAPAGASPLALEVLIVAEAVAVISVMVALSSTIHVPIGYATIDKELVRRITELSRLQKTGSESTRLWPKADRS